MVRRRAAIIGSGKRVIMTGSSLFSRAATIQRSRPSRAISSGRTWSSLSANHLFRTWALSLNGSTVTLGITLT